MHVTLVAFDPVQKTTTGETAIVYAGVTGAVKEGVAGGGLLVSTDSGATWGLVNGRPKTWSPPSDDRRQGRSSFIAYGNGLGPNGVTDERGLETGPRHRRWTDITPVKPARKSDVFGYGGLSLDPAHPGTIVVSTPGPLGKGRRRLPQHRRRQALEGPARGVRARHRGAPLCAASKAERRPGHGPSDRRHRHRSHQLDEAIWRHRLRPVADARDLTEADRSATRWRFDDEGLEETGGAGAGLALGRSLVSTIGDIGGFRHDDLDRARGEQPLFRPARRLSTRGLDLPSWRRT